MKRKEHPSEEPSDSHHHSDHHHHSPQHQAKRQKTMATTAAVVLSPPQRARDPSYNQGDDAPVPEFEEVFRQAWFALDEDDEKLTLHAEEKFGNIADKVAEAVPTNAQVAQTKLTEQIKRAKAAEYEVVTDPEYKGPHLKEEITEATAQELLDAFSQGLTLHPTYATRIISAMRKYLKKEADTVNEITIPEGGRVVVVGDTHGQLTDLNTIFRLAGFPSPSNRFLFNGDFVDRGPQDVEILLTIYCMKLANPTTIFFNRGNHEQRHMNERYNFEDNVRARYSPVMFELIQKTFKYLPLASLIQGKVYVTHGGLFPYPDVTLDEIKALERWRIKKGKPKDRMETLMQCVLWSDPQPDEGWKKSDRGAGVMWGPDLTDAFVKNNGLEFVIRSHEMVEEGSQLQHNDRCMTLFSASNYCGTNENQGAVVIFSNPLNVRDFQVQRYFAEAFMEQSPAADSSTASKERLEAQKSETLQKIRERIFQNRHKLSLEFSKVDEKSEGVLPLDQFLAVLQTVLKLPLNWGVLWRYLAKAEPETGAINYTKFLDRYKMAVEEAYWNAWADSVVSRFCTQMYAHGISNVRQAFEKIDVNGDKNISYAEFVNVLKSFDLGLSEEQMYDLMRSVDANKDGHIDYDEFMDRFANSFCVAAVQEQAKEDAKWTTEQLLKVSQAIMAKHKDMRAAYESIEKDDKGDVTPRKVKAFFRSFPELQFSPDELDKLVGYMDKNNSNNVSYKEFKRAIKPRARASSSEGAESNVFFDGIIQTVCGLLHKSKIQLRRAFRMMDIDGSGKVDVAEFKAGLEALNLLSEVPLSDTQIQKLHALIDKDHDGTISYEEFFESFRIVDKEDF